MKTGLLFAFKFRCPLNLVQCPSPGKKTSGKVDCNFVRTDWPCSVLTVLIGVDHISLLGMSRSPSASQAKKLVYVTGSFFATNTVCFDCWPLKQRVASNSHLKWQRVDPSKLWPRRKLRFSSGEPIHLWEVLTRNRP